MYLYSLSNGIIGPSEGLTGSFLARIKSRQDETSVQVTDATQGNETPDGPRFDATTPWSGLPLKKKTMG